MQRLALAPKNFWLRRKTYDLALEMRAKNSANMYSHHFVLRTEAVGKSTLVSFVAGRRRRRHHRGGLY